MNKNTKVIPMAFALLLVASVSQAAPKKHRAYTDCISSPTARFAKIEALDGQSGVNPAANDDTDRILVIQRHPKPPRLQDPTYGTGDAWCHLKLSGGTYVEDTNFPGTSTYHWGGMMVLGAGEKKKQGTVRGAYYRIDSGQVVPDKGDNFTIAYTLYAAPSTCKVRATNGTITWFWKACFDGQNAG